MRPSGLSTPSALSRRGVEEKKIKNRARARARGVLGLVIDAVRTETVHGLRNDQGMPVFTPGSNPRRLPAAACRRGSWFLSSSREEQPRARGGGTLGNRQKKKKKMSLLLSRFICITDFETPERNIPYMWPSLKTRPDCGCSTSAFSGDVLREGGERDARF